MPTEYIYLVRIQYLLVTGKKEPEVHLNYFSNLKRALESVNTVLATHSWAQEINYSAVYREIKLRNLFAKTFAVNEVKYFRLTISKHILNPPLPTLGIEEMP